MMKKKIRVSKDPSSSSTPYFPDGDEARARFKYDSLLQDYQELLLETQEKRDRFEKILQKRLQLLAEVKFLRRKFQQFSTTQTVQFKLKKPIHRLPSPSGCVAQPKNPLFQTELPLKRRSQKAKKQFPAPTSTAMLDLNQAFLPVRPSTIERHTCDYRLPNYPTERFFARYSLGCEQCNANIDVPLYT